MVRCPSFYIPVRIDCLPVKCNIWVYDKFKGGGSLILLGTTGKDLDDIFLKRYCYKMSKGYNDYILCKNRW